MNENLVRLRRQAEKAVGDMKDGPIKEKAFEVILSHLLEDNGNADRSSARPSSNPKILPAQKVRPAKNADGPMGRVAQLAEEGFFRKPKHISDVRSALRDRGSNYPVTTLGPVMVRLTRRRALRRSREKLADKKLGFVYSNW